MCVTCVVPVMSTKAEKDKGVYDAAGQGKTDVIKTLFEGGADLNGYKDDVSKPVTISLTILLRAAH